MAEETNTPSIEETQKLLGAETPIPVKDLKEKKPHIFRITQWGELFWGTCQGKTGALSHKKALVIAELKKAYPGEYQVIDILPPAKKNSK